MYCGPTFAFTATALPSSIDFQAENTVSKFSRTERNLFFPVKCIL